jgi:hypothetical protein
LGDGGQGQAFREGFTVAVVEGVHKPSLFALLGVFRKVQRAFLAATGQQGGHGNQRDQGSAKALHGQILVKSMIAPEYTGPPAPCLCARFPPGGALPVS